MSDVVGFDPSRLPVHKQEEFFVSSHNEIEIIQHIHGHWAQAKSSFIRMGMALFYARQKYGPRSANWALIRERMDFSKSMITKLIAIGADERIRRDDVFPHLPDAWGTIYLVTRLTDEEIYRGINGGEINPNATRQEVGRYVADSKHHSGGSDSGGDRWGQAGGLNRLFYDDLPNDFDARRPDEDEASWAKRVLWWNQEIKRLSRPLFNIRIDYNRITYEEARKAIELSRALREIPHVYTTEVNQFAIRRLEDRAIDEFVKRMDVIANLVSNIALEGSAIDPVTMISAGLKGDDGKLLGRLDRTHPLRLIIQEEFDRRVLGKEPREDIPIPLKEKLRRADPFGDPMVMLRWIQEWESPDEFPWEDFLNGIEEDRDLGTEEDIGLYSRVDDPGDAEEDSRG